MLEKYEEGESSYFTALDLLAALGQDPGENPALVKAIDELGYRVYQKKGLEGALGFFHRLTIRWDKRHQWWSDYGFFSLETNMKTDEPRRIDMLYEGPSEKYEKLLPPGGSLKILVTTSGLAVTKAPPSCWPPNTYAL